MAAEAEQGEQHLDARLQLSGGAGVRTEVDQLQRRPRRASNHTATDTDTDTRSNTSTGGMWHGQPLDVSPPAAGDCAGGSAPLSQQHRHSSTATATATASSRCCGCCCRLALWGRQALIHGCCCCLRLRLLCLLVVLLLLLLPALRVLLGGAVGRLRGVVRIHRPLSLLQRLAMRLLHVRAVAVAVALAVVAVRSDHGRNRHRTAEHRRPGAGPALPGVRSSSSSGSRPPRTARQVLLRARCERESRDFLAQGEDHPRVARVEERRVGVEALRLRLLLRLCLRLLVVLLLRLLRVLEVEVLLLLLLGGLRCALGEGAAADGRGGPARAEGPGTGLRGAAAVARGVGLLLVVLLRCCLLLCCCLLRRLLLLLRCLLLHLLVDLLQRELVLLLVVLLRLRLLLLAVVLLGRGWRRDGVAQPTDGGGGRGGCCCQASPGGCCDQGERLCARGD
jgi:hypothetical protein